MASSAPFDEAISEGRNSVSLEEEEEELQGKQASQMGLRKGPGGDGNADDDFDVWMKSRQLQKPDDQLELTEAELAEEISKVLTPQNTNVVRNLVVYSFKQESFVPVPLPGNTVTLTTLDSTCLLLDSEEAQKQIDEVGELGCLLPQPRYSTIELAVLDEEGEEEASKPAEEKDTEAAIEEGEEEELGEEEGREDGDDEPEDIQTEVVETAVTFAPIRKHKLINQFNFCERAALTYKNPKRNVDTQTIPPPRSQYGANVLQWNIYDSYAKDFAEQQALKEKKGEDKKGVHKKDKKALAKAAAMHHLNRKYLKCWQILERMINQNMFEEIANDYRYWDDPADEFRDGEGTLLPLWKFNYERTKKMSVTDLLFNPEYYDLFAVCFGSHEFTRQPAEGSICLFTIKNPSYPDYIIMTTSSVMCCDIHRRYPYLLVIGMFDGNVAVYNIKENANEPLYVSLGVHSKHSRSVSEMKWGPDMADGEINFFSASCDGTVVNWVLMQNKLNLTCITKMYNDVIYDGPDGTDMFLTFRPSCLQFHPNDPEIFLVGTEEGLIFKCSTAFSSKYIMTYNAHNMSVYRIDFNRYNSNIFISCSGDWRIKIWEDMRPDPLFIFDLGSAVGDVKWAPFSSTVFAAPTNEGKVCVYDINVNKYKPICVQAVVPKRKSRLTCLAFNEKLPFIIVGDDKGTVTSLKLSPNLRVMVKPPKKQLYLDQNTLQTQKLEKLLSLVREMPGGTPVKAVTATAQS